MLLLLLRAYERAAYLLSSNDKRTCGQLMTQAHPATHHRPRRKEDVLSRAVSDTSIGRTSDIRLEPTAPTLVFFIAILGDSRVDVIKTAYVIVRL
ncbi:hypothetical protein QR680_008346 [Steinernema hermaphroditum]|uniref:Uncharacterized protein n=1 Tax=Steinernema hermaphroditum TaxID=289476 RepID=A0AA39IGA5_9BILA|nr:hypothetical protein QR680_008346 [Steinernema hermaphroditum]